MLREVNALRSSLGRNSITIYKHCTRAHSCSCCTVTLLRCWAGWVACLCTAQLPSHTQLEQERNPHTAEIAVMRRQNKGRDLPTEILCANFHHLPLMSVVRCRQVCTRWRHIVDNHRAVLLFLIRKGREKGYTAYSPIEILSVIRLTSDT